MAERREKGFAKQYYGAVGWAIDHRKWVLSGAFVLLALGFGFARTLKTAFFPQDLSYLSYVDVWLPEDAPLSSPREKGRQAEQSIEEVPAPYGKDAASGDLLRS